MSWSDTKITSEIFKFSSGIKIASEKLRKAHFSSSCWCTYYLLRVLVVHRGGKGANKQVCGVILRGEANPRAWEFPAGNSSGVPAGCSWIDSLSLMPSFSAMISSILTHACNLADPFTTKENQRVPIPWKINDCTLLELLGVRHGGKVTWGWITHENFILRLSIFQFLCSFFIQKLWY